MGYNLAVANYKAIDDAVSFIYSDNSKKENIGKEQLISLFQDTVIVPLGKQDSCKEILELVNKKCAPGKLSVIAGKVLNTAQNIFRAISLFAKGKKKDFKWESYKSYNGIVDIAKLKAKINPNTVDKVNKNLIDQTKNELSELERDLKSRTLELVPAFESAKRAEEGKRNEPTKQRGLCRYIKSLDKIGQFGVVSSNLVGNADKGASKEITKGTVVSEQANIGKVLGKVHKNQKAAADLQVEALHKQQAIIRQNDQLKAKRTAKAVNRQLLTEVRSRNEQLGWKEANRLAIIVREHPLGLKIIR